MFQVYTIKRDSDFSKTMVLETKDFEEAMEAAEKAVEADSNLKFIVEETSGHFNSYGDLETTVVAKSE